MLSIWKDIWGPHKSLRVVLIVFHILAYKTVVTPGYQDTDALAQIQALAAGYSVDWVHRKSGLCSSRVE